MEVIGRLALAALAVTIMRLDWISSLWWAEVLCVVAGLLLLDLCAVHHFLHGNTFWDRLLKVRRDF